jgi:hypothetical protein
MQERVLGAGATGLQTQGGIRIRGDALILRMRADDIRNQRLERRQR